MIVAILPFNFVRESLLVFRISKMRTWSPSAGRSDRSRPADETYGSLKFGEMPEWCKIPEMVRGMVSRMV